MIKYLALIKAFIRAHTYYSIAGLAVLLIGGGLVFHFAGAKDTIQAPDSKPQVKVGRVIDVMNGGSSLSATAEIRSVSEAKISAESSGRVSRVNASLGQFVSAGQILAEMENASQRAALLQAEGALDAVKASLPNTATSLDAAKAGAVNTLLSAYASNESAVHETIDDTFSNPDSNNLKFLVLTQESQLKTWLENNRPNLTTILKRESAQATTLSSNADLQTELAKTESELRTTRAFLDTLIKVLNAGISAPEMSQATITGYITAAAAARTSITTSLAAVASAQSTLEVASNNSGDSGASVSVSSASLKQAQGAYNAALAALEKTIIRSPISGTLNNFTIKLGDFLTQSQEVAVVSNTGALEAVASVTEEDRARISVGQKVTVDGDVVGEITKIAPALDPITRRIEVHIGLPASAQNTLSSGQSVHIAFSADSSPVKMTGPLSIPITALKIEASRAIVFTVQNDIIVSHEIKIGKLSGDSVQVTEGLTADTEIVIDVRGLKEGDSVTVAR